MDRSSRRMLTAVAISLLFWILALALGFAFLKAGAAVQPASERFSELLITLEPAAAPKAASGAAARAKAAPEMIQAPTASPQAAPESRALAAPAASEPAPAAAVPAPAAPALASAAAQTASPPLAPNADAGPAPGASPASAASAQGGAAGIGTPTASSLAILNTAIKNSLKYPPQARKRGIEGKVEVDISVGAGGALMACELAGSSGSRILDDAALKLLKGLFPLAGGAEAFRTRVAIEYRLN